MLTFFQSPLLQALGFAIANSLWQMAFIWFVCSLLNYCLPFSSSNKYRIAVTAQILGFIWFIVTMQFYYQQYQHIWQESTIINSISQNIQSITINNNRFSTQLIKWMVVGVQTLPYLSMAYLLIMLFLLIRWFFGYQNTQTIRKKGLAKIPVEWRLFVSKIASQLQIKKEISLYLSDLISTPMTIGFIKPIILIPLASINHLTTQQLEAIILHELAHIKRLDYIFNIFLSVIEVCLFFNPFTQLISKQIKTEREHSCDDWVLQFQYNATIYAEALLQIAYLQHTPQFAMAATGKKSELLTRIKRLIEKKENHFNYKKQLIALVIITAIISSIAWLSPMVNTHYISKNIFVNKTPSQLPVKKMKVDPLTIDISNPLFNPTFFLSTPLREEIKRNIVSAKTESAANNLLSDKETSLGIEAIQPIVASALDIASVALAKSTVSMKKELAALEVVKKDFATSFRIDSNAISNFFLHSVKDEIAKSMKIMEKEMAKAKREMANSERIFADIPFDQEKINREINEAMNELKKGNIEKLVSNSIQIQSELLNKNFQKNRIITKEKADKIKEEIIKKKQKDEEMIVTEKEMEEPASSTYPKSMEIVETINLVNSVFTKLALLAKEDRIQFKNLTEEKIEKFIKNLSDIQTKVKTTPIQFTEKNTSNRNNNDRKIVFSIQ